jgi:multidrug resistance efflux pump
MVDLLKVVSPIAGVVVEVRAHKGEAVQPSQPVIRVINLDSLWVQGDVPAGDFARSELDGRNVTVDVVITRGVKKSVPGKVTFVKPLTDKGGTYMVRAKVDNVKLPNGSWLLYEGMPAEMNIQLSR